MKLNENVLSQLKDFGRDLEGFKDSYAVDGLVMAQGFVDGVHDSDGQFVGGIQVADERPVWLMALDLMWVLWLDDRIDTSTTSGQLVDWEFLLHPETKSPISAEGRSFVKICDQMAEAAFTRTAFDAWKDSAVALFAAYHANWLVSSSQRSWGYAEYLENGEISVTMPHFLAAVSLACNYAMESRRDALFCRIVKNLSLAARLQNDLASAEKERSVGDRANAVLLIERFTTLTLSREFVRAEQLSYEKMLLRDLALLSAGDPIIQLAKIILAMMDVFYKIPRVRYMLSPQ